MTAEMKDEYNTLRQELQEHQVRRLTIINTALVITAALFAAATSKELQSPYLPLFALLILHSARIQLIHANEGVQRIATYLRIIHEGEGTDLHWETGSYNIRRETRDQSKGLWRIIKMSVMPFSPFDTLIFSTSIAAFALALIISEKNSVANLAKIDLNVLLGAAIIWFLIWIWYCWQAKSESNQLREKEFWDTYKKTLVKKTAALPQ